MQIFLSDIEQIAWLRECLPSSFREMGNKYFVFGYDYIDNYGGLNMGDFMVSQEMTDTVYRKMHGGYPHYGFLKQPFSTNSTLFYNFLLTSIRTFSSYSDANSPDYKQQSEKILKENEEKLKLLFIDYKIRDFQNEKEKSIQTKIGRYIILDTETIEEALEYFIKNPLQRQCAIKITELFNGYFKTKYGKSFYNNYLHSIVLALRNLDGMFIPEERNNLRYMIVGENSMLSPKEKEMLEKAKDMFRGQMPVEQIWHDTAWYMNMNDGLWRKRISDASFFLNKNKLTKYDADFGGAKFESQLFVPPKSTFTANDIHDILFKDELRQKKLDSYNGVVSDIISHETLFAYYPEIALLKMFCGFYPADKLGSKFNVDKGNFTSYFYTPENNYILFRGNAEAPFDENIFLHEMQHYIQSKEGFATGGSSMISSMIISVGGSNVKQYFQAVKYISDEFVKRSKKIDNERIGLFISDIIKKIKNIKYSELEQSVRITFGDNEYGFEKGREEIIGLLKKTERNCSSKNIFVENSYNIAMSLVTLFISNCYGLYENEKMFFVLMDSIGLQDFYEPFNLVKKIRQQNQAEEERLKKSGWSNYDLRIYYFNIYKGLFGEVESRDAQQSKSTPKELEDYLLPYSSEAIEERFINVIFNDGVPQIKLQAFAAVEVLSNAKYCIHLTPTGYCEYFIHELGHILFDEAKKHNFFKTIESSYLLVESESDGIEHFFIEHMIGFFKRNNIDNVFLEIENKFENDTSFDEFFNEIFFNK